MTHPAYPPKSDLRLEATAERLLSEQFDATTAFHDAVAVLYSLFQRLHFPLGSPVADYDLTELDDLLGAIGCRSHESEDAALDAARRLEAV